MTEAYPQEIIISELCDLLYNDNHVAVGAASPIPGAASILAQEERKLNKNNMRVTILHSNKFNNFTDGSRELFDVAAQGRIDTFFLGGIQIDGKANINLVGTGVYPKLEKRFSGSFGSALMYYVIPKIILFREEHSIRSLVNKVDFISAPGTTPKGVYRPGGPKFLMTNKALFSFNEMKKKFFLLKISHNTTLNCVIKNTGFKFLINKSYKVFDYPNEVRLKLLRDKVAPKIRTFYPEFAKRLWYR